MNEHFKSLIVSLRGMAREPQIGTPLLDAGLQIRDVIRREADRLGALRRLDGIAIQEGERDPTYATFWSTIRDILEQVANEVSQRT